MRALHQVELPLDGEVWARVAVREDEALLMGCRAPLPIRSASWIVALTLISFV